MKDCVSHMIFLLFFLNSAFTYLHIIADKQAKCWCGPLSLVELEKGMCDQSLHSIFLTL